MAEFFTSERDLAQWVKDQSGPEKASNTLMSLVGNNQQDIIETCAAIHKGDHNAAKVLFSVLGKYGLIGFNENREANMSDKENMKKEAQTMRSGLYNMMPLRVCPKLPYSRGKRLISTFNCREHCLDSLAIDDDPTKIYCLETMWRRHVMDKFAREFKNDDGEWVGGYINERFHRFPDAGTPANPDVDRYHGNNMQLAHGERSRKPKEHQYSFEARLEEQRGAEPIFHEAKKNGTIIRLAEKSGGKEDKGKELDNQVYGMFDDMIEMKEAGLGSEDIVIKCAEHHKVSINEATKVYHGAMKQMERYNGKLYAYTVPKMTKTASDERKLIAEQEGSDFSIDDIDVDLKKKVKAQTSTSIPGAAKSVPVNQFAQALWINVDGNKNIALPGGTLLTPTNLPDEFLVHQMPNATPDGITALQIAGDRVKIVNPDVLVEPLQANVDIANDMLMLEGLPETNMDLDEAADALMADPEGTVDFIQEQNNTIGPINAPSPEALAAENQDVIVLANDFEDINKEIMADRVKEIQEQFAKTAVDPNMVISCGCPIDLENVVEKINQDIIDGLTLTKNQEKSN